MWYLKRHVVFLKKLQSFEISCELLIVFYWSFVATVLSYGGVPALLQSFRQIFRHWAADFNILFVILSNMYGFLYFHKRPNQWDASGLLQDLQFPVYPSYKIDVLEI